MGNCFFMKTNTFKAFCGWDERADSHDVTGIQSLNSIEGCTLLLKYSDCRGPFYSFSFQVFELRMPLPSSINCVYMCIFCRVTWIKRCELFLYLQVNHQPILCPGILSSKTKCLAVLTFFDLYSGNYLLILQTVNDSFGGSLGKAFNCGWEREK